MARFNSRSTLPGWRKPSCIVFRDYAQSGAAMHASYLNTIKRFEGFSARTQWDYAQSTNGYGTKAQFAGERISLEEAERRFQLEISRAESLVDGFAPGLEEECGPR